MSGKGFTGAPFGKQSYRFSKSGVHPKNLLPGTCTTGSDLGPGAYDPEYGGFSVKAVAKRALGPGWKREYELSHMLALPYLLNKEEWEKKKLQAQRLGPGYYDPKYIQEKEDVSTRGLLDLKEKRFHDQIKNDTPGPGAYGIPHAILEAKAHQTFSYKGMLDCGTCADISFPLVGCDLGPGTYNFKDSIDQMLKKRTGLRGPYDVFTLDRSKPIITGHYATLRYNNLSPGEYEFKSGIEEMLTDKHKRIHGIFNKQAKYPRRPHDRIVACTLSLCPRDPSEPGPGYYDPKDPNERTLTQGRNLPGFLSSSQRSDKMATKFFTGNFNHVGVGRYEVQKFDELRQANGHESVFLSKSTFPQGEQLKFLHERIKEKNVPLERRFVLVEPGEPRRCTDAAKATMRRGTLLTDMARRRSISVS